MEESLFTNFASLELVHRIQPSEKPVLTILSALCNQVSLKIFDRYSGHWGTFGKQKIGKFMWSLYACCAR